MFFEDIFELYTESRCFCKHSHSSATATPSVVMPSIWPLGRVPLKKVLKPSNSCSTLVDFPPLHLVPRGNRRPCSRKSARRRPWHPSSREDQGESVKVLGTEQILSTPLGHKAYDFIRARLSSYYVLKRQGPPKSPTKT